MSGRTLTDDEAWQLLLAVRAEARRADRLPPAPSFRLAATGTPRGKDPSVADLQVNTGGVWSSPHAVPPQAAQLLDLFLPVARAGSERPLVLAQLGQSLDGRIATLAGQSHYITGEANLDHLHRLRALSDAVIVGAGTVAADDPRLTTRRVAGPNPVRVVLDPDLGLAAGHRVFNDAAAPSLVVCSADAARNKAKTIGRARLVTVEGDDAGLSMAAVVARLRAEGLAVLFVEGGGVTVSRFLAAGLLDRLHLAVAPLVMGSGRSAFPSNGPDRLAEARRMAYRSFAMGDDLLLDLDLRSRAPVRQG